LRNIYYDFDKATLRLVSEEELANLKEILNANPQIIVEIGSHTDSKGNNDYNERLSQKRAESVVKFLVKNGIPPNRLTAKGYGESKPVAQNTNPDGSDNPEGRQKNRRTEFRIIGELEGSAYLEYLD
jgi:outer membrane protein OmpA-like peptidoglycan-associated protein